MIALRLLRRGVLAGVAQAAEAAELARSRIVEHYRTLARGVESSIQQTGKQAAEWTAYYQLLADGARGIVPSGVPGRPSIQTRGITPVPLSRYTGEWIYSNLNPRHIGPEPQFVQIGRARGQPARRGNPHRALQAPSGDPLDPVLQGDFSGALESSRNQVFTLQTCDGGKGKVELIPGAAFNLPEVSLTLEPRPGKLLGASFLLVKK